MPLLYTAYKRHREKHYSYSRIRNNSFYMNFSVLSLYFGHKRKQFYVLTHCNVISKAVFNEDREYKNNQSETNIFLPKIKE